MLISNLHKLTLSLSLFVSSASFAFDSSRCEVSQNSFQLNPSHINALIALSCSGLTHIEVERKNMVYEDGATLFHNWKTTLVDRSYKVEGYCSLPLTSLNLKNKDRFKISLEFSENQKPLEQDKIIVKGTIAGKTLSLSINENEFIDQDCPNSLASSRRLQNIGLGLSLKSENFLQNLKDILVSQRSGASLNLLETASWPLQYQRGGAQFQGLALPYSLSLWSGRRVGVFATSGELPGEIRVRSANVLDYYEGGNFLAFNKNSYGEVTGFSYNSTNRDNHIYKASSHGSISEVKGCSSLVYDGELSLPKPVNYDLCTRFMN